MFQNRGLTAEAMANSFDSLFEQMRLSDGGFPGASSDKHYLLGA
jgi:hypothetical protein